MEVLRKYGVAAKIRGVPLVTAGAQDFFTGALTAGDVKISKDDGTFANIATLPSEDPASGKAYLVDLSATEMQAESIVVRFIDSATKAWEDQMILVSTYGHASAQHALDLDDASTQDDVYTCKLMIVDDDVNSVDRYIAIWFKNGAFVAPDGTPNAKLWVFEHDGGNLVGTSGAPVTMSEIGSTDIFYWVEVTPSERLVDGAGCVARAQADIDGSQRTWYQTIGRDSA